MFIHGITTNPFIAGASVHKQRTEHLWCDVFRYVLSVYHWLFYYFEERGKLDPLSERDLYCLHLVYSNKINTTLKAFQDGWNNHAISLLPIASKILEHHIHSKIMLHLQPSYPISDKQWGFCAKTSTVHALLSATNDWLQIT